MVGGTDTIGTLDERITAGTIVVVEPEDGGDGARGGGAAAGAGGAATADGTSKTGGTLETGGAVMVDNVIGGCCRRVYTYATGILGPMSQTSYRGTWG
jgi:hypothetical protein